ncbi:MAG: hypothetical protein F4X70_05295 [Acidimicrobiia bacterium]|nr:hypothetical protein [Acidimicrobiia bacterium]
MRDPNAVTGKAPPSDVVLRMLEAESAEWDENGPTDPYDTTYSVPHQHEDWEVEFNLLTVTVDDIIAQCGYPESARPRLAEVHRRLAEYRLSYYKGPINGRVPLLEATTHPGVA